MTKNVWTSRYEPVPVGGATLPELVHQAAATVGDRPALVDPEAGLVVSYPLLAARIAQVANGLRARGFGAGEVLAICAPNVPQWAGVALGAMAAGGAVTGVDALATERELATQLRDSGATILVTTPVAIELARAATAGTAVRDIVVLGDADGAVPIAALLGRPEPDPVVCVDDRDLALLPYSSGTTGLPKGVRISHANIVTTVRQLDRGLRVTARDTMLALPPFSHIMGFMVTLAMPLAAGATVVTMARFDLERMLALIARHRVSVLVVPPPVMAALARHPLVDRFDLTSLELVVSGGAPLGAELQCAVASRLPHAAVGQGWGMTETTVGATIPDRDEGTAPGSVGRVMPNTEIRVVDPVTGRDCGADEPGELWVRGPQVTGGYHNRPEATAVLIDAEGWLRTGDLGRIDAAGDVFVIDRLKELIKVAARPVAPAELEALLAEHPAVADAAVIPRPDPERGEVPVAVVALRSTVDIDELMAWVAARVAPYKRIRDVRVVDALPRGRSGKLLRRQLVEEDRLAQAGSVRDELAL